jgi:hypothetical protein
MNWKSYDEEWRVSFRTPYGRPVANLAIGHHVATEAHERLAARPDDDLADPEGRVRDAGDGLRREPLVAVAVTGDHEVDAGVVQRRPERGAGTADRRLRG